jgi:hypothetical protein
MVAIEDEYAIHATLARGRIGQRLQDVEVACEQTVFRSGCQTAGQQHGAIDERALDVGYSRAGEVDGQSERDGHRRQQGSHQHPTAKAEATESEATPHPVFSPTLIACLRGVHDTG